MDGGDGIASVVAQRRLWGDYGDVLVSGYARRDDAGRLALHRAGPFLPPISFPCVTNGRGRATVVTDAFRAELDARFPGLEFRRAVKHRIVRLAWHEWPRSAKEPARYPESGEPEEYIWEEPHDAAAAAEMPGAWELVGPTVAVRLFQRERPDWGFVDEFDGVFDGVGPAGIGVAEGRLLADDAAKAWLAERVAEWVRFAPVEAVAALPAAAAAEPMPARSGEDGMAGGLVWASPLRLGGFAAGYCALYAVRFGERSAGRFPAKLALAAGAFAVAGVLVWSVERVRRRALPWVVELVALPVLAILVLYATAVARNGLGR